MYLIRIEVEGYIEWDKPIMYLTRNRGRRIYVE